MTQTFCPACHRPVDPGAELCDACREQGPPGHEPPRVDADAILLARMKIHETLGDARGADLSWLTAPLVQALRLLGGKP